jgi:hypothetical protein
MEPKADTGAYIRDIKHRQRTHKELNG